MNYLEVASHIILSNIFSVPDVEFSFETGSGVVNTHVVLDEISSASASTFPVFCIAMA